MIPGQFIVSAAWFGLAVLSVMAACLIIFATWAAVFWWRDRRHDVGADQLRLLQDLDKHLDHLAANDPEVKAGLARLDAAVRAEHEDGTA
jgi:hypothetical protein